MLTHVSTVLSVSPWPFSCHTFWHAWVHTCVCTSHRRNRRLVCTSSENSRSYSSSYSGPGTSSAIKQCGNDKSIKTGRTFEYLELKKINIQMNSKILIFWQFSWMSCYKIFSISFLTTTCSYKLKKKYCTFEILNACRWIHTVLLSANYYMQVHPTNSKLYSNCFCQPLTWHLTDI